MVIYNLNALTVSCVNPLYSDFVFNMLPMLTKTVISYVDARSRVFIGLM